MTELGGITIGGLIVGAAWLGYELLRWFGDYVSAAISRFCDVRGEWDGERPAHDHVADDDAPALHGLRVESETTAGSRRELALFTGGRVHG
jgi:hypothetical protein